MIRARFVLCAQWIIHNRDTNAMSAIEIVEMILVPSFPVVVPTLAILGVFGREVDDPREQTVKFRLDFDGQILANQDVTVNFNEGSFIHRAVMRFVGLALKKPGKLRASFSIGEIELGVHEMQVEHLPRPAQVTEG